MKKQRIGNTIKELNNMIATEEKYIKNFGSLGFTKLEGELKIIVWLRRINKLQSYRSKLLYNVDNKTSNGLRQK